MKWILLDVICMEVLLHGDLGTLHGSSLSGKVSGKVAGKVIIIMTCYSMYTVTICSELEAIYIGIIIAIWL